MVKRKGGAQQRLSAKAFNETLAERLPIMKDELKNAPLLEHLRKEREEEGGKAETFGKIWRRFTNTILDPDEDEPSVLGASREDSAIKGLRRAFDAQGQIGLDNRIKYAFYAHVTGSRFTNSSIENQRLLADLRYPTEWFPATRRRHRTIHLHVGPTNSGKTYQALQRLEQAPLGVYAGPLRLLAHEVYTRMNAKGRPCNLITGEERRLADDGDSETYLSSCTVEMMSLNTNYNVAVIDEIQMIGDADRGWAWTQALLGVKATEVHLCGEERTVPLIREICASLGEKLEIHRYERLSPLAVAEKSLGGDLGQLRKGDCLVSFSVLGIQSLRRRIERATGKKVAVVYGSLPPETRASQARLFNDPDNDYDYLVASDAVGMGLNLAIKRVIFESSAKFDGIKRRTLRVADIKQIAGRAGRYRTSAQVSESSSADQPLTTTDGKSPPPEPNPPDPSNGLVTTLEDIDYPTVAAAMRAEPSPIRTAGLFPPAPVVERFASYFPPGTPFSYILTRLHELTQLHPRFHLCSLRDQTWLADLVECVPGLTAADRNIITSCPASSSDKDLWQELLPAMARCVADQSGGSLLDLTEMPLEVLEAEPNTSREYLRELERLHKGIVGYLWLSYRFAGIFTTRPLAFHVKSLVEQKIEDVLGKFNFKESSYRKVLEKREKAVLMERETASMEGQDSTEGESAAEGESIDGKPVSTARVGSQPDPEQGSPMLDETVSLATEEGLAFDDKLGLGDDALESSTSQPSPGTSSFARWRGEQTRGESQASHEGDLDQEGLINDHDSTAEVSLDHLLDDAKTSSSAEAIPESSTSPTEALSSTMNPEDSSNVDPSLKPTNSASSSSEDQHARAGAVSPEPNRPAGHNQLGGVPPKHLGHLHVNTTELEREADSRP